MATTEKLISSLIQQTKNGKLNWDYLSNYHKLETIATDILEDLMKTMSILTFLSIQNIKPVSLFC